MRTNGPAITVGKWRFYPVSLNAVHMDNYAYAEFRFFDFEHGWTGTCTGLPSGNTDYLDLSDWFGKWVKGECS